MKLPQFSNSSEKHGTLIARFGKAALIRKPEGAYQLAGGSRDERLEAREWISLFMHEAVVSDT